MRKDRTIISELQEFFLQNDAHLAINSISDVMSSLKLHKNKIGIEKADNCKFTALQIFHLLLLFPFFMVKDAYSYIAPRTQKKGYLNDIHFSLLSQG